MKKLFSLPGTLLFVTLPQALLAAALFYAYTSTALTPSLPLLIIFGIQALFNGFIILCSAMDIKGPGFGKHIYTIQLAGFIAIISAALPFLLMQFNFATSLSPEAIYGTLCMIPLIYIAAAILHRNEIPLMAVKTRIVLCVCVPLVFALLPLLAISGLFDGAVFWLEDIDWAHSAASIVLILLFALFFVFVCLVFSILYHYRTKKPAPKIEAEIEKTEGSENPEKKEIQSPKKRSPGYSVLIFFLALVLPLLCLYLNNEAFMKLLGDFSGAWFYILALMNGIAMLIPRKNKWLPLVTLCFKSAGLLYVFYFVVTMLRFAPLGVAFYAYLLPLLTLTPIILFVAELFQIIDDVRFLRQNFTGVRIIAVLVCGALALGAGFFANGYAKKVNFDNAMCYLSENEQALPPVKVPMLQSTLRYMRYSDSLWSRQLGVSAIRSLEGPPILSEIYHRIIFKEQTLDDELYARLQRIFMPEEARSWQPSMMFPDVQLAEAAGGVKLDGVKTEIRYDEAAGVYKAWVRLTLKNKSEWADQEYAVKFTLPEGVFVSDYYLDVFGQRKYGIVSEKNTAKSIYDSIVSRNRDPGLICYAQGSTIELRVFPFGAYESRETGFELMFRQSDAFNIGAFTVTLAGDELTEPVEAGGVCFMPASYKANLEVVSERTPKYYFIADVSEPVKYDEYNENYLPLSDRLAGILAYAQKNNITEAEIYLTDYNAQKIDLAQLDTAKNGQGGFNLALAMDKIYKDAKSQPGSYPVILVAAGNYYRAAVADNRRFAYDFPETEFFYLLDGAGSTAPHRFSDNLPAEAANTAPQTRRLFYNGFYFSDNEKSEVSYGGAAGFADIKYDGNVYLDALRLSEKTEKAGTPEQVIETLRDGISKRILTRYNSFIVLETKEQEEELNRRNQEFLDGKTLSSSSSSPMSEPGLLVTLLLLLALLLFVHMKHRKRRKLCNS